MSASSSSPRVVLLTGAARRLGREIALALARSGWVCAIHFRGSADDAALTVADCAALTPGAAAFGADLADEAACRALVPQVVNRLGRLDAVVHCASLFEHDTAQDFSYASAEAHLRTNTSAAIVLAQQLHAHVTQRSPGEAAAGVLVTFLDQKLWNPNPDFLSYTLSKAALKEATILLAQALAPALRVVGVAPGLTITSHMLSDERFEALHRLSPLGRSSTPGDVAASVRFALDNRSITGTTLLVDGGQHLMRFERDFSLM